MNLASIYFFKVSNKNTRTTKMTFFKYFASFSSVFIVGFEQVNISWKEGGFP